MGIADFLELAGHPLLREVQRVGAREQGEEPSVLLPEMPLSEHVVNDYQTLKLSLKAHPMQFLRGLCHERKVTDNARLKSLRNGAPVPVSRIEFYVLAELIGARGRVLSRDYLLRKVWGYGNAGDGRVVDNLIYRLRSKIEEDPANPQLLTTVRGFGYRMKA